MFTTRKKDACDSERVVELVSQNFAGFCGSQKYCEQKNEMFGKSAGVWEK